MTDENLLDSLREVKFGGLTCWSDGCRIGATNAMGGKNGIVFLSLIGPQVAVRAVWAKLLERTPKNQKEARRASAVKVQGIGEVARADETFMYDVKAPLKGPSSDWTHVAMVDSRLSNFAAQVGAGKDFLVMGDKLPQRLMAGLNARMAIPFAPEWADLLWRAGQQPIGGDSSCKYAIPLRELRGFGAPMWLVSGNDTHWKELLRKLARTKELF